MPQSRTKQISQKQKPRMEALELLRCIAMMMVVVLHYLGKGNLLQELTEEALQPVGIVAWIIEVLCIVAVNVYMLISGYFLSTSSFKLSRLLKLYLQVWCYSAGVGIMAVGMGILPAAQADIHYFLTLLFPISMGHYWFMTAYVFLYILLPFLGAGLRKMNQKQLQVTIGLLLLAFCLVKTVLPVRLEEDANGCDCLWYLCVFTVAAYIRKYGIAFLKSRKRALLLYIAGCAGILVEIFALRFVYLRTGSLERILKISLEYNHLFPFLAAVGLFAFFWKGRLPKRVGQLVNQIAPYTLGVYLLHENMGLRYAWQSWLGADRVASVAGLLAGVLGAVVCVFSCGILVDMLRVWLTGVLHRGLCKRNGYRRLLDKIKAIDDSFALSEEEKREDAN